WESQKSTILELYLRPKSKLQGPGGVIETMSEQHQFIATKSQYEARFRKWGIRKNLRGDEWQILNKKLERRKMEGKQSDVYINEVIIPKSKIRKEIRR
ncbi:hypothetical protein K469DRAFT_515616, partial [Zopfia rhizophila CBS 207.26]